MAKWCFIFYIIKIIAVDGDRLIHRGKQSTLLPVLKKKLYGFKFSWILSDIVWIALFQIFIFWVHALAN